MGCWDFQELIEEGLMSAKASEGLSFEPKSCMLDATYLPQGDIALISLRDTF